MGIMRKIGIFSAKGGVGKTTLAANLGAALTIEFNRDVILLDGNISDANLALHFGITYPHLTLNDILKKKIDIRKAIYLDENGIKLIPSSLGRAKVDPGRIKFLLRDLKNLCEILLIDSPPSLAGETIALMRAVDEVIIVTTPNVPSIAGCVRTLNLAERCDKKIIGVVLNRAKSKKYETTTQEVESTIGTKVISVIPEDKNIKKSLAIQRPVVMCYPDSPASIQFFRLAAYLIGEEYPYGFLDRLLKRLFGVRLKERIMGRRLREMKFRMREEEREEPREEREEQREKLEKRKMKEKKKGQEQGKKFKGLFQQEQKRQAKPQAEQTRRNLQQA